MIIKSLIVKADHNYQRKITKKRLFKNKINIFNIKKIIILKLLRDINQSN